MRPARPYRGYAYQSKAHRTAARRRAPPCEDMCAFHGEPNAIKRDVAAHQLHAVKRHYTGRLRLFDVKEIFEEMRDRA